MVLAALLSEAELAPGGPHLPGATRDPKDTPWVACAGQGHYDSSTRR